MHIGSAASIFVAYFSYNLKLFIETVIEFIIMAKFYFIWNALI